MVFCVPRFVYIYTIWYIYYINRGAYGSRVEEGIAIEGGNAGYRQTGSCTMVLSRTTLSSSETKANNSNAHLACFKCAEQSCRITSTGVPKQNVVFDCTLGFRNHTAGLINYQMAHLRPTLNKFWTNRHTMFFVGRGGDSAGIAMPPPLPR